MSYTDLEQTLIDIAVKRLLACDPTILVPYTWRRRGKAVFPEGSSVRYTAMVLIGLSAAVESGMVTENAAHIRERVRTLRVAYSLAKDAGDIAVMVWAFACSQEIKAMGEASTLLMKHLGEPSVSYDPRQTMWFSWALNAFCECFKVDPCAKYHGLIQSCSEVLLSNQNSESGLFYRKPIWVGLIRGALKKKIAFFSDQVYPIHALSSAYEVLKDQRALKAAGLCLNALIPNQRPKGSWPWVYNVGRGIEAEKYPVYSVHQYGMFPMAFRRFVQFHEGNYEQIVEKSMNWLFNNEANEGMVDWANNLVWRSVRRRHFERTVDQINKGLSAVNLDPLPMNSQKVEINHECRPYELGWLLYALSLKSRRTKASEDWSDRESRIFGSQPGGSSRPDGGVGVDINPEISIIIVNYNVCQLLLTCLESIMVTLKGVAYEVILVDNASSDGSVAALRERFPQFTLIANTDNVGFAGGVNQAYHLCKGDFILVLNPDTLVLPGAVKNGVEFMKVTPDAGIAVSRILNPDGRVQKSINSFPGVKLHFVQALFLDRIFSHNFWKKTYFRPKPFPIDYARGAFFLVRRKALGAMPLLDPDFFMYAEEKDLSLRLRRKGWKTYFVPTCEIVHYGSQSSEPMAEEMYRILMRSQVIFFRKHFSGLHHKAMVWSFYLHLLTSFVASSLWIFTPYGFRRFKVLKTGVCHYPEYVMRESQRHEKTFKSEEVK